MDFGTGKLCLSGSATISLDLHNRNAVSDQVDGFSATGYIQGKGNFFWKEFRTGVVLSICEGWTFELIFSFSEYFSFPNRSLKLMGHLSKFNSVDISILENTHNNI